MAIGDEEQGIQWIDWAELYSRITGDDAVIAGIAFRGRWTAIVAPAKAGKSTVLLALAIEATRNGLTVLYVDAEMGRGDVLDRVEQWMRLKPADLANLHYTDLPPKLDSVEGASLLYTDAERLGADLVIIDGLNGTVNGGENDDTTWRDMYEWAIAPLKRLDASIISADNLGKNRELGPRGSSVKLDKVDAILAMERTDNGCKITATHRRTSSYPKEQTFIVDNASEEGPPLSVRRVEGDWPAGTKEIAAKLDRLGVPHGATQREARRLIEEAGETAGKNAVLSAAMRWRREQGVEGLILPVDNTGNHAQESGNQGGYHDPVTRDSAPGVYEVTPALGSTPEGDDPDYPF